MAHLRLGRPLPRPEAERQNARSPDGQRQSRISIFRRKLRPIRHQLQESTGGSNPFYASDYFDQIYEYAVELIQKGKAYVCDLSPEDTEAYRGSPDKPGKDSPVPQPQHRGKPRPLSAHEEAGEFPDGARTLRAKIDMASPNIWLRDPILYRIRHAEHHHTGDKWCIYPMYDFAHCLSDYIEGITHSICTLEFEVHRPLYDWILENLDLPRPLPHQYEFARLSLGYTVMSKRKLMQLVNEKLVTGWDDPRMPTICGLRRRGVTPEALRDFAYNIGITKYNALTDVAVLEHAIREDLNKRAPCAASPCCARSKSSSRIFPKARPRNSTPSTIPKTKARANARFPFSRELVHRARRFHGSAAAEILPAQTRRRSAPQIRLHHQVRRSGERRRRQHHRTALHRRPRQQDRRPDLRGKVKGTIHWVSAAHAIDAEVPPLRTGCSTGKTPEEVSVGTAGSAVRNDFTANINPHSLEIVTAKCEPSLKNAKPELRYQFERLGYFALDPDSQAGRPLLNRTITLKDAWAKIEKKHGD